MNPVERSVWLPCGSDRAFNLFTVRISDWWPADRKHTGDPESTLHLEESGRFVERARDGREVPLGRVTGWVRPERIVLDFYPGTGPDQPTAVEIVFVPEGDGTRVRVTHRPTAASDAIWQQRAPRFDASWDKVLGALALAAR